MHRFFSSNPLESTLILEKDDRLYHQLVHVFRVKIGEELVFFEEGGADMLYSIDTISRKQISCVLQKIFPKTQHVQPSITLFQAYLNKMPTMEIIIQKCVELGISSVVFFPAEHSQLKSIPPAKYDRLELIATEALEQCGGNSQLKITCCADFSEAISLFPDIEHFVGFPGGDSLCDVGVEHTGLWIGPEGGWSQGEEDGFLKKGWKLWSFNTRILRAETASIVGAGILAYKKSLL